MDDKELMEHISHILYYGNERNIELSLTQLWDILKKNDCRIAQGYFFDMPLPIKVFEERLDSMNYSV